MNIDRAEEKQKILRAQKNPSKKEAFLEAQKQHILKLTAHIIHTPLSMGDDEWSIAFSAVAEAIDNVFIPDANGDPTKEQAYRSVDGVESKGIEFELDGKITNNWDMSFGITHFSAEDAAGKKVETLASRTTANLFTKYTLDKWSVGGGVNYKSAFYTGEGSQKITQDAYALANLMVAYDIDQNIKAQLCTRQK